MKNLIKFIVTAGLVLGIAGAAPAAFDPGNMFFVAYEENEVPVVRGINDQPGFESFFDLGTTKNFVTAIQNGDTIDTNIGLGDFNTGSWGDVFVATFGESGGFLGDTSAVFSSDDPNYAYNALSFGFDTGYKNLAAALTTGPNVVVDKGALTGTYIKEMQATGTEPGTYGGPVSAGTTFGAELNLAGISTSNLLNLAIYGGDTFADLIDPDSDYRGQLPLIAGITLGLDAADGSLLINPSAAVIADAVAKVGDSEVNEVEEGAVVTLDGTGSTPQEELTYDWEQVSGSAMVTIQNQTSAVASFTAPSVGSAGADYAFKLTVTDGEGNSAADEVTVAVIDNPPTGSIAAGLKDGGDIPDPVPEGTAVVLQGSVAGGGVPPFSYLWDQTAGTDVENDDEWSPNAATTGFTIPEVPLNGETLTFRLTVTDVYQNSRSETLSIYVESKNSPLLAGAVAKSGDTPISDPDELVPVKEGLPITLDGSASSGGIGDLSYTWVQTNAGRDGIPDVGGDPAWDANSVQMGFKAPNVPPVGATLTFELTVTDTKGNTDTTDDVVQVLIEDNPPAASIAADLQDGGDIPDPVLEGTAVVLQGSVAGGGVPPFSYLWAQTGGTHVENDPAWSANSDTTGFTIPVVPLDGDTLTFLLTVTDDYQNSHTASVSINVESKNSPPVARAVASPIQDGKAQEGLPITLDGSASSGGIGDLSYTWVQTNAGQDGIPDVSGDPAWGPNSVQSGFKAPDVPPEGATLTFQLTVTDDFGNTAATEVQLLIEDNPPDASAVARLLETNALIDGPVEVGVQVVLDGSGSVPGVGQRHYAWDQTNADVDGVPSVKTDSAWRSTSAQTGFTAPNVLPAGATLAFQLTVTDDYGNTDTATVDVAIVYTPPQAAVTAKRPNGEQVSAAVPVGTVITLDGSQSEAGSAPIVAYLWEQIAGPDFTPDAAWTPANPTTAFTAPAVPVGGGSLRFKLTVTDANNVPAEAFVTIDIEFSNNPPVARAGAGTTADEGAQIVLDGSASDDPDVGDDIQSYQWKVTNIPEGFDDTFDIPDGQKSLPSPLFTAPRASNIDLLANIAGGKGGTLEFELTVTDLAGATATDTVTVTVKFINAAPAITQAAGTPAQAEPGDSVVLSGAADDPDLPRNDSLELCWKQTGGPQVVIGNALGDTLCESDRTTYDYEVMPAAGIYEFQFSATDESGASISQDVIVNVITPGNEPPVANLIVREIDGADLGINQPVILILGPNIKQLALDGSGSSDPDGTELTYTWNQYPPEPNLLPPNADTATILVDLLREEIADSPEEFDLKFQLTVDDQEWQSTATVVLRIVPNQIPRAPAALGPIDGIDASRTPILEVAKADDREAATYPDRQGLRYVFEVWKDDGDRTFDATEDVWVTGSADHWDNPDPPEAGGVAQGENTVSWQVDTELEENTVYFWSAWAWDGLECGAEMVPARFFVNTINTAPSTPQFSYPPDGGRVLTRRPTLKVTNAADPDINDLLFYEFRIYDRADAAADEPIAISPNVAQSTDGSGQTAWTLDKDLVPGTTYWWRVRAGDEQGAYSDEGQSPANFIVSPPNVTVQVDGVDFNPQYPIILGPDPVGVKLGDQASADSAGSRFTYTWVQEPSTPNLLPPNADTPEIDFSLARQDLPDTGMALDLKFQLTVSDSEIEVPAAVNLQVVFNQTPGAPGSPIPDNSEVAGDRPILTVANALDQDVGNYPGIQDLYYVFEVWQDVDGSRSLDETTDLLVARSSDPCADPAAAGIPQGQSKTSWQVPEELLENTAYLWRAWTWDGLACSAKMPVAGFLVNTTNDPPSQPRLSYPPDGGRLLDPRPTLTVQNAADADVNDRLFYEFRVYSDATPENLVTGSPLVPQATGDTGHTAWPLDVDLAVDTQYWWQARTSDGKSFSNWTPPAQFRVSPLSVTVQVDHADFDPQQTIIVGPRAVRVKLDGDGPSGFAGDRLVYTWTQTPPAPNLLPPNVNTAEFIFNLVRQDLPDSVEETNIRFQLTASESGVESSASVILRFVQNTAPAAPSSPRPDGRVDAADRPELRVSNAYDRDVAKYPAQQALEYVFEVWRDTDNSGTLNETGDKRVAASADPCDNPGTIGVLPGDTNTSWPVDVALAENSLHFWRAWAWDGLECGAKMAEATFFVKGDNDPPGTPVIKSPIDGDVLAETDVHEGVVLRVHRTTDPDINDRLFIEFVVYSDPSEENQVAGSPLVAQAAGGSGETETAWTIDRELDEDTAYWWKARAVDDEGAVSAAWTQPAEFRINRNNSAPVLTPASVLNPKNGVEVAQTMVAFEIENARNLDGDEITYDIWLDTSPGFDSGDLVKVEDLAQNPAGITRWTSPQLVENQKYHWQVRAKDEQGAASNWIPQWFVVNQENEPPVQPAVIYPADGSDAGTLGPTLLVEAVADPEGDNVLYDFRLYPDGGAPLDPIHEESDTGRSWTITEVVLVNRTCYEWQVRAKDARNLATSAPDWVDLPIYSFCTNGNFYIPTMPRINNPFDKGTVNSTQPVLSVYDAFDGDGDPLVIVFEIYEDIDGSGRFDLFDRFVTVLELLQDDDSPITRADVAKSGISLENGKSYLWRARAEEDIPDGNVSQWMTTASFQVGAEDVVIVAKLSVVVQPSDVDSNPGTPEIEDADTGVSIDLSASVIDAATNFSVGLATEKVPALAADRIRASEVFALGPSGMVFDPPLVIGLPHTSPFCDGLEVLTYSADSGWTDDGITVTGCTPAGTVFAEVVHFSLYTVSSQSFEPGGGSGSSPGTQGDSGGGGGSGCFIQSAAGDFPSPTDPWQAALWESFLCELLIFGAFGLLLSIIIRKREKIKLHTN